MSSQADVELLVVGDHNNPVKFVLLPIEYHGSDLSPSVTVEDSIVQALSSTGLFSMPFRYDQPEDINHMIAWQLAGIRYVLQGEIYEVHDSIALKLTIYDTLGLQPTISTALLNPKQIALSSQMFADQVYRSLFYATFTNDQEKQYLNHENPTLTRYLNHLVMTFKQAWSNNHTTGTCTVDIQQMPGGVPFKNQLDKDCFLNSELAAEIQQVLATVERLPYDPYQEVFEKNLRVQFVSRQ
jgi:hypothetical protein